MPTISLPSQVHQIISILENRGYQAYAVGGCIRDSLLGKTPKDWDICTNALPQQIIACFSGYPVIENGLQHGTVTIGMGCDFFEVTTFRIDGTYSDNRRPDSVEFVDDLTADLARRDFTINAMAYRWKLVDPFHGLQDLQAKLLRCVGDPHQRFQEDALRILRALRFASSLGFEIEAQTHQALFESKALLCHIAAERIAVELNQLLLGPHVFSVFMTYSLILAEVLPEICPSIGFQQDNPYHCYDVWEHTATAVAAAETDLMVRLALLFHDLGKPFCYSWEHGIGHFFGHSKIGEDMAMKALHRLKYSKSILQDISTLVLYHNAPVLPQAKSIKRYLNKMPLDLFLRLLAVKRGDIVAQEPAFCQERLALLAEVESCLNTILDEKQCFSLKDLAVKGGDILSLGAKGPQVGQLLQKLLELVLEEEVPNEYEALMEEATKRAMKNGKGNEK